MDIMDIIIQYIGRGEECRADSGEASMDIGRGEGCREDRGEERREAVRQGRGEH